MFAKKRVSLFCSAIFFLTISQAILTTAQGSTLNNQRVDDIFNAIQGNLFAKLLLGDFSTGAFQASEVFFIKFLVFLLLIVLINYAVRKVPGIGDRVSLSLLIAIIVSLISVRYMTSQKLIETIWLPYGVLGIFLATLLPFILGFFFIESFSSWTFRRVAWSLYVVIFAGLAWFRWDSLQGLFPFGNSSAFFSNGAIIYLATAVLSFLLIIFDRQVRASMHKAKYKDVADRGKKMAAIKRDIQIDELYEDLKRTRNESNRRAIQEEIARLEKDRDKILAGP